jgi:hypothetical protein
MVVLPAPELGAEMSKPGGKFMSLFLFELAFLVLAWLDLD